MCSERSTKSRLYSMDNLYVNDLEIVDMTCYNQNRKGSNCHLRIASSKNFL